MEPNHSTGPSPTNGAGDAQASAQQTTSDAQNAQGSTGNGSSGQKSGGNNWIENVDLKKVMDQLPQGARDFFNNPMEQVKKMNTTQLVAGALALAGIGYLAMRSGKSSDSGTSWKKGKKNRGSMPDYQRPQQSYRSGSGHYSDVGSQFGSSSFDRQNQSRAGGSYQQGTGSSSADADFGSGSHSSSSYGDNRSRGYRGTSGNLADTEKSGSDDDF